MIRILALLASLLAAACALPGAKAPDGGRSLGKLGVSASPRLPLAHDGSSYKVGKPYKIGGRWYRPKEYETFSETGIGSWYGHKFHGRKTANGEVFNMYKMTAAHRVLPMPSVVRVTNLSNGRSVVLRVNDRGPYARDRVIDLSLAAAEKIGYRRQGVTRVRVELLPEASRRVAYMARNGAGAERQDRFVAEAALRGGGARMFYVQAGTFRNRKGAERLARALKAHFDAVQIRTTKADNGRFLHRVRIGPVGDRKSAAALQARVRARGPADAFVVSSKG